MHAGLVCDAVFTDFDNDGWPDLILAGEWMPVSFLKNDKGVFKNITDSTGIHSQVGWWNTIVPGDFDNDGDIDYIVGNMGTNSFYRASEQFPVSIYASDFDNNGSFDAFPTIYLPTSQLDQTKREFPVQIRDDIVKQMIGMRAKFQNYRSYARATIDSFLNPLQLKDALTLRANNFKSMYLRNDGHAKFTLVPLPMQAQISVLNGMVADDFDGDGNLDVLINGNDYGTEVSVGKYDALNGLFLKGDGKGNFVPLTILQSGIYIPGNGKALVKLRGKEGRYLIASSQNNGPLRVFALKGQYGQIPVLKNDEHALIQYNSGKTQKQEFYFGSSFLSQSGRFIKTSPLMKSVTIYNSSGQSRTIIP